MTISSRPPRTLCTLARERAASHPDRTVYSWLSDGQTVDRTLTLADVDRRARAVAARLQRTIVYGDRVLLLYPPGLDFIIGFLGCVYAGAIAVPAYTVHNPRQFRRIAAMAEDSQPAVVLTVAEALMPEAALASEKLRRPIEWIATDRLAEHDQAAGETWKPPSRMRGEDVLYLQYTSGSTADPKGVMITHANVLANLACIASAGGFDAESTTVTWLPHFHDMGLVYGCLQPLFSGLHAYQMAPAAFMQKPARWLQAISACRATHSGGPNFAYDLCTDRVDAAERDALDLRSWRVAFNGAEPIRANTLDRFAARFAPCGFRREAFYPVYGLAEATLKVTSVQPGAGAVTCAVQRELLTRHELRQAAEGEEARTLVGCGLTDDAHQIAIVDPATGEPCEADRIGEIWVSGPSVARGYWKRPRETRQTFKAHVADNRTRRFLRTGDLGVMRDGQLFVVGRISDTIIIRGRNYHPQDIEMTVEACSPAIRRGTAVAFGIVADQDERLVIVAESAAPDGVDLAPVAAAIRAAVGEEHELQVHAVELLARGSVPRTSSGKLQRAACRRAFLEGAFTPLYRSRRGPIGDAGAAIDDAAIHDENDTRAAAVARRELMARSAGERTAIIEGFLLRAIARAARIDGPIDAARSPAALGMDSLLSTELAHRIERDFGIAVPPALIAGGASVHAIAVALGEELEAGAATPPAASGAAPDVAAARGEHEPAEDFPLSYGQRALWFLQRMRPESTAWNITRAVRLRGPGTNALRAGFARLVARHAALRTTFATVDGAPVQRVRPVQPPQSHAHGEAAWLEVIDASGWTPQAIDEAAAVFAAEPLPLDDRPPFRIRLLRVTEHDHVVLVSMHHIIADLWSLSLLWRTLLDPAAGASARGAASYFDFVDWQHALLGAPEGEAAAAYWLERLSEPRPHTTLARGRTMAAAPARPRRACILRLDASLTAGVKRLAAAHDTTTYVTLLAAFLTLLHRETGDTDLLIGSVAHGRGRTAFRDVVGCFVNTLPIRADVSGDPAFEQVLARVSEAVAGALTHGAFPFPTMVERLRAPRDASLLPVLQIMFVHYGASSMPDVMTPELAVGIAGPMRQGESMSLEVLPVHQPETQFELTLTVAERADGGAIASFDYDATLLSSEAVEALAGHFETLVRGAVRTPEAPISTLDVLSKDEEARILRDWNETAKSWTEDDATPPAWTSLRGLLAGQALETPDAVAVTFGDANLTYADLAARANRLARLLRSLVSDSPEPVVAVCWERSLELMICLAGILEAGAAYLPIDSEYPDERVRYMLAQAGASVVLCQPDHACRFNEATQAPVVCGLPEPAPEECAGGSALEGVAARLDGARPAYVIFTSGSTGRPKGVMVEHAAICNRLLWMREHYAIGRDDVIVQKTPLTFDVSVWELFLPLISCARLVLAAPGLHRDARYLADLCQRAQATTIHFVPRMLRHTLDEADLGACRSLRRVICSGEALPVDLCALFFERCGAELHNLYGPTEAAVDVTAWRCAADDQHVTVPIGRPISNTRLYVLDRHMRPVPPGCPGALYIAGVALARGYVNRPDLTAAAFVPDPVGSVPGARLYRTGDLARHDADGALEFLGRADTQVKIRGLRVETEEIESVLAERAGVRECAVLVERNGMDDELIAYVVLPDSERTGRELRAAIASLLPPHMLPARFVRVDRIPLSSNGKLDRAALRAMGDRGALSLQAAGPAPLGVSETEARLIEMWTRLLGEEVRRVDENFFILGGHSLLAMRMAAEVRDRFGVELPIELLFTGDPTIARMAAEIDQLAAVSVSTSVPAKQ